MNKIIDMWIQDETHIGMDIISDGKRTTIIYPIKKFLHIVKKNDIIRIVKSYKKKV